jgi:hypothetical protein
VLTAQAGDALRVWLLGRRAPEAGYPLLAGTLVAEAAGALVAGMPVLAIALAAGLGPAIAPSWHMGAGLVAAALAAVAASWAVRRRARGWRVLARVRDGCALLARPRAYARAVSPWQCLSRACEIAAWACFLGAFHLPVSVPTVLLVVLAQAGGRVLAFAPAALGAMVAMLSVTFARVAHTAVDPGRLAVFVVGTTGVLTATGAVLAALIVLRVRSLTQAQRSANPLRSALAARWLHDQTVSPEAETA